MDNTDDIAVLVGAGDDSEAFRIGTGEGQRVRTAGARPWGPMDGAVPPWIPDMSRVPSDHSFSPPYGAHVRGSRPPRGARFVSRAETPRTPFPLYARHHRRP